MLQVLVMASAATSTVETSAATAVKASATASMEPSTAVLTASTAPVHASFHSMSGAAVSETVPEIPAMVVRELTAAVVSEIAATATPEIATMIEAATVIKVSIVMVTATPVVEVMIKMFMVVAVKAERSKSHEERRIEAPPERAVVDTISGNIGVGVKVRIPVPAGTVPIAHAVHLRLIYVRFGNVGRPQAAPVIEIVHLLRVELLGLQRSVGAERDLMLALDLDILVHVPNDRLAFVHADLIVIGVKLVQPGFGNKRRGAVLYDHQIILRMKLRDFDHRASLVQAKFDVGQARRNHGYGAVVIESEESARRQKNLCFADLRIERLTRLHFGRTYCFGVEGLPRERDLPFDIINGSWACWVCAKSWRRQSRSQDDACCNCDQP